MPLQPKGHLKECLWFGPESAQLGGAPHGAAPGAGVHGPHAAAPPVRRRGGRAGRDRR